MALALTTSDAVGGPAMSLRHQIVVIHCMRGHQAEAVLIVKQREVLRNGYLFRTAVYALSTACTGNGDGVIHDFRHALYSLLLGGGKRLKIFHKARIFLDLFQAAHAAEHHHHAF